MDTSLWGMVVKGGWLMIPIFLLSVVAIYIACERWWQLRKLGSTDEQLMDTLREALPQGDVTTARDACLRSGTPLARVLAKGITFRKQPSGEIRQAMENQANLEVAELERGFSTLATCAGTAPMIGFLGTVVGMIQAFYDMAMAGSSIDIGLLSRGIYTAMITTVAGLIVGIIGQLAYNFLVSKVDRIVQHFERYHAELVELLLQSKNRNA